MPRAEVPDQPRPQAGDQHGSAHEPLEDSLRPATHGGWHERRDPGLPDAVGHAVEPAVHAQQGDDGPTAVDQPQPDVPDREADQAERVHPGSRHPVGEDAGRVRDQRVEDVVDDVGADHSGDREADLRDTEQHQGVREVHQGDQGQDALVLLRVSQIGFSVTGVIGAYVVYNVFYTLVSYPAGVLADRMPRARVYALGLVCFAIGYVGLGLVNGGWAVIVLLCVYGGFNGVTDGVGKAWISSLVPPTMRGRAQGVFQGFMGGSVLIAGLWAGLIWNLGPGHGVVPLIVSGAVAAVAAPLLWAAGRRLG